MVLVPKFHSFSIHQNQSDFWAIKKGNMSYSSLFISGAANTVGNGLSWVNFNDTTLVIYALSNCVAVADANLNRVLCTLRLSQTDDKINVLKTVDDSKTNSLLVIAGSEKGSLTIWK